MDQMLMAQMAFGLNGFGPNGDNPFLYDMFMASVILFSPCVPWPIEVVVY